MENNENLVVDTEVVEAAENTEQTVEETPKTYTEAEFNAKLDEVLGKKIARREAKIRKEYERKYGDLEETLRAGTGKESVEEINETLTNFYESKGIKINKKPEYSARDIEVLARAEADDYIRGGLEDVVEEVDRLAEIGVDNMTAKEKAVFKMLAEHRQNTERYNELSAIGVTDEVYNSKEFQDFARMFNPNTPITDIYTIYAKQKPQKEHKNMGSMKQSQGNVVKDYYTPEEIERLTEEDLDNPKVWEAVRRSMTGR
jgi:hypothetical protein